MRRVVQSAAERTDDGSRAENINISDPKNIVVAGTTGEPGAVHSTSSRQRIRVRQDGHATHESDIGSPSPSASPSSP